MKQNIIKNGIIAGVATIGYVLLFYYIRKEWLFTGWFLFSSLLIYAFFMYRVASETIKADFKTVLRNAFAVFLIANALYYAFDYALYNVIDKSLADVQKTLAIEYFKPTTPVTEQAKLIENITNSDIHNVSTLAMGFARGAIGGFGLALLITFLLKRRQED